MKITFDNFVVDLTPTGRSYRAMIGEAVFDVEIIHVAPEHGRLDLRLTHVSASDLLHTSVPIREPVTESVESHPLSVSISAYVSSDGSKRWVTINGQTTVLTKSSGAQRRGSSGEHGSGLTAPMPGLVRSVNVVEGESVTKGQTLLVLEAMKMEIRIQAKSDGVVMKLLVKQGQTVEREQVLIEIE